MISFNGITTIKQNRKIFPLFRRFFSVYIRNKEIHKITSTANQLNTNFLPKITTEVGE